MNIKSYLWSAYKYKVVVFSVMLSMCIHAMEMAPQPEYPPLQQAFEHFDEDAELIREYLKDIKAELHFYWTTGRTLDTNKTIEYGADINVEIGGLKYGRKFIPYITKLLEVSPNTLGIRLVLDWDTFSAYEEQLNALEEKYNDRFKLIFVHEVHLRLLSAFPNNKEKINMVFKNAMEGLPVIPSDIYRLIGMLFGQYCPNLLLTKAEKQCTYCDVDLFCWNMEQDSHQSLIKALFQPANKDPFYVGVMVQFINNDLIKLRIAKGGLEPYKKYCVEILNSIANYHGVLTHFVKLHEQIKKCEDGESFSQNINDFFPSPFEDPVFAVTFATGPKFLANKVARSLSFDLDYHTEVEGEWCPPEVELYWQISKNVETRPIYILRWINNSFPDVETEKSIFETECDKYRSVLGAAFYAKRFGKNHPYNKVIWKYLMDNYPYKSEFFEKLLKANFDCYQKHGQKLTYEDWKKEAFNKVTDGFNHYRLLSYLLEQLGIEFPALTEESFDYRRTSIHPNIITK